MPAFTQDALSAIGRDAGAAVKVGAKETIPVASGGRASARK